MRLKKGFTLIELVIVVAIMALLIFASLPSFQEFIATSRLRQGCYDVISALRTARASAIGERTEYMTLFYTTMKDNRNLPNFKYAYPLWSAVMVYNIDEGGVGGWKRLPENIYLDYTFGNTDSEGNVHAFRGMETGGDGDPSALRDPPLPYPNEEDPGDSMPIVIFRSSGKAVRFGPGESFSECNPDIILKDCSTQDTAEIKVLGTTGRIYLYTFKGEVVQE